MWFQLEPVCNHTDYSSWDECPWGKGLRVRDWEVKKLCRKCDTPGWQESSLCLIFHVTKEHLWLMVPCVAAGLQGLGWWALSGSRQCNDFRVNFLFSLWRGFCFPGEGLDLQHSTSGAPGEPGGWRGWGYLWRFWKGFHLLGLDWEKNGWINKFPGRRKKEIRAIKSTILCGFFLGVLFALMFLFGWVFFWKETPKPCLCPVELNKLVLLDWMK